MFPLRLGITLENKAILETALLEAAVSGNAVLYREDEYGVHYDIRFPLSTDTGDSIILSCWIIRQEEDFPRLTNAYAVDR